MKLHRSYDAIHRLLSKTSGPASEHACVGCGKQARDWALQTAGSGVSDSGLRYSVNLDDYAPMCRSCHRLLDQSFDGWALSQAGTRTLAERMKDPEFHAAWVEKTRAGGLLTPNTAARHTCVCGMESNLLGIERHQRSGRCAGGAP